MKIIDGSYKFVAEKTDYDGKQHSPGIYDTYTETEAANRKGIRATRIHHSAESQS